MKQKIFSSTEDDTAKLDNPDAAGKNKRGGRIGGPTGQQQEKFTRKEVYSSGDRDLGINDQGG